MKKGLLYGTTAVVSFFILITIYAPANVAFQLFGDDIRNMPETRIYRVGGTIWQGTADLQFRDFPISKIAWQLTPLPLLQGVAALQLHAGGMGHEISADLQLADNVAHLQQLNGFLDSVYVNQIGQQYGFRFSGTLQLQGLDLTVEDHRIKQISGHLHWNGGQMRYQLETGIQAVKLPSLDGELSVDNNTLTLNITHQRLPVLSFVLQPSGWVTLRFRARIFDLAALTWPAGSDLDDIVLTIEEKIL